MSDTTKQDEELFFSKLDDLFETVERKCIPKFTMFLDEKQVFLAKAHLERRHFENWLLWGGYENATRKILGVFPDYIEPDGTHFPISPLTFRYREEDQLTHRDFLGSLMALQIKREAVGDILVSAGNCVLFVTDKVEPLLLNEVTKIGRTGVKIEQGITVPFSFEQRFQEITGTVASMRLDCMVSLLTGKSREKSCDMIKAGLVSLNHREVESNSASVEQGDILTVRGYGKAKVGDDLRRTKKDRCFVTLFKYI